MFFAELKRKGASDNYESMFRMALSVFKHQSVFNLTTLLVQSLEDWTEDPDTDLQNYCGQYPTNYDIENNVAKLQNTRPLHVH